MASWRKTVWILFVVHLLTSSGFSVVFPFLPLYVLDLDSVTGLRSEIW